MGHIEREADALRQHLVHTIDHLICWSCLVIGTPLVKPTTPEFRAHLWGIRTQFAQTLELLVNIRTRTEVHGPYEVIETILLKIRTPVALEKGNLITIDATQTITNRRHIGLILTIRAIFILDLYHDDRTTVLNSERCQLFTYFLLENLYALHEVRILLAQTDILLLQEPPRQTTHLPLRTSIGTRTNDDIHTILLCQSTEFCHIIIAREIELALTLFMDIPEYIDAEGVHAKRLTHLDAMLPVRTRDTRIMHFSCLYDKRFAV